MSVNTSLDASGNSSGDAPAHAPFRLKRAGQYSLTATYKEHRPKVLDALGGTPEETVTKTVYSLTLTAGRPTRIGWARAAHANLACNNTTGRQVFARLEARLEDEYGNPAVAGAALHGARLMAVLAPPAGPETPASSAAAPPRLEGSLSGFLDASSCKVTLGPGGVEQGTGRGDSQLRISFRLLTANGEVVLPALELPEDLEARFEDTFSQAAEEARAREANAAQHRQAVERHSVLKETHGRKQAELERCEGKRQNVLEEMRALSADLLNQAGQVSDLDFHFSKWVLSCMVLLELGSEDRARLQQHFQINPSIGTGLSSPA
jgi:hypothetical protein